MVAVLYVANDAGSLTTADTNFQSQITAGGHSITSETFSDPEVTSGPYDLCVVGPSITWTTSTPAKYLGANFPTLGAANIYWARDSGLHAANTLTLPDTDECSYVDTSGDSNPAPFSWTGESFGAVEAFTGVGDAYYVSAGGATANDQFRILANRTFGDFRVQCWGVAAGDIKADGNVAAHNMLFLGWEDRWENSQSDTPADQFVLDAIDWLAPGAVPIVGEAQLWDGTAWVDATTEVWDGSAWVATDIEMASP